MVKCQVDYPERIDPVLRDLISKLLIVNPLLRLGKHVLNNLKGSGAKDAKELMKHPFFKDVPWEELMRKGARKWTTFQPPNGNNGLVNFDRDFTNETPHLITPRHPIEEQLSQQNELQPNTSELDSAAVDPFDEL